VLPSALIGLPLPRSAMVNVYGPVMEEPSEFLATGTVTRSNCVPVMSPCQPLLKPTSPAARPPMSMRPPRFGTCWNRMPLDFDMSIGFVRKKVAVYSTMPRALRGANWISWMMALRRSAGSTSPVIVPAYVSYWPAWPNDWPLYAGETLFVIVSLVTRASAAPVATSMHASASPRRSVDMESSSFAAGPRTMSLDARGIYNSNE
jgi:hypothetical protein